MKGIGKDHAKFSPVGEYSDMMDLHAVIKLCVCVCVCGGGYQEKMERERGMSLCTVVSFLMLCDL